MQLLSWLRQRTGANDPRQAKRQRNRKAKQSPRSRPWLEAFEDRTLLSTLVVLNNLDDGSAGSLRALIAAASSGDTITFDPQSLSSSSTINLDPTKGELFINKDLSITGLGVANLTISGQNSGQNATRVFEVAAGANVSLADLTVTGGNGVPNNPKGLHSNRGGGIVVDENSTLTITGSIVSANSVTANGGGGLGGGIADYGTLTVSDCTVTGNHANTTYGGGIAVFFGTLTVNDGSIISNNEAKTYGGGIAGVASMMTVSDSMLSENSTDQLDGGAINVGGGSLTMTGCTLSGNTAAENGGGISTQTSLATTLGGTTVISPAATTVSSSTLTGNSVGLSLKAGDGGGIFNGGLHKDGIFYPGTLTVNASTLSNNSAGSGGGISNRATLTVSASTLSNNSAYNGGGAIESAGIATDVSVAQISGSTISDNVVTDGTFGGGGGISNFGMMTVSACTLSGNSAGLIPNFGGGGAIANGGSLIISDSILLNNAGPDGGGIANGGQLWISGCTISGNSATQIGGGISNSYSGTITVSACVLSGNSARNIYGGEGGAIYNGGALAVSDSTLANNSAAYGGGIENFGPLSISGSTISGNSATVEGGGIFTDLTGTHDYSFALADSIIAGNSDSFGASDILGAVGTGVKTGQPVVSAFNNLIGNSSGLVSGLTNGVNGNRLDLTADQIGLAPLADNGGPTQTMALLPGSLALGAGAALDQLAAALAPTDTTLSLPNMNYLDPDSGSPDLRIDSLVPGFTVLRIDDEQLLVTAVSGDAITVKRGYNGTAAADHAVGAGVYSAFDQRGLLRAIPPCIGAYEAPSLTLDNTSLDLGTTTYGTAGSTLTYTLSGNALVGDVIITAPFSVELSTNGANWSTSLTLTPSNSTLASTSIDVRISAGANAGNLSGVIQDISSGANEVDVSLSGLIKPATLTITPASNQSKIYGDAVPTLNFSADGFGLPLAARWPPSSTPIRSATPPLTRPRSPGAMAANRQARSPAPAHLRLQGRTPMLTRSTRPPACKSATTWATRRRLRSVTKRLSQALAKAWSRG
jgi:parallel beta-helix repeat protein